MIATTIAMQQEIIQMKYAIFVLIKKIAADMKRKMTMIDSFSGQYNFLSNFYPVNIIIDDEIYPTVEHAFQAMKCDDPSDRETILACKTPADAKRAGRKVKLRRNWERDKADIMYMLVRQKFNNPELALKLKETRSEELVEGNTWNDTFWGMCNGVGCNMLGKILMQVRDELNYDDYCTTCKCEGLKPKSFNRWKNR